MNRSCSILLAGALAVLGAHEAPAASHREAPVTATDRSADITDFYAFVSPDRPDTATFIVSVDPLLEPGNGPNYFPFDDNLLYAIRIDNDNDAVEDLVFEFRFETTIRAPGVPVGLIGVGDGIPGIVPPAVTALDGPGSEGLSLRQSYTVRLCETSRSKYTKSKASKRKSKSKVKSKVSKRSATRCRQTYDIGGGRKLFAVPSNVGPRTMPDYAALAAKGIYDVKKGIRVFAGTTDDAFYIDLGAAFDTLNFRVSPDTGPLPVLSPDQDARDDVRFAPDDVSGYNVNSIAIQVPISLLTRNGRIPKGTDRQATIGAWGTTSRRRIELRNPERPVRGLDGWVQVQRMANPLINELIIGTGDKDLWSRSEPRDDARFADYALAPLIAVAAQAAVAAAGASIDIPPAPRLDLLPLVTYAPPIAAEGTPAGPIADLLRLNLGVPPTDFASASRLGVLGGDFGGFPNGRRPLDDVTDIVLRVVVGGVLVPGFDVPPNNLLGDGVNTNDAPRVGVFPYLAPAQSGRDSRHVDPGEPGCDGGVCP